PRAPPDRYDITRIPRAKETIVLQKLLRSTAFTVLLAAASALVASGVNAQSEQQKLIDAADASLSNFVRDPEMKWLQENLPRAKGVLIAPEVLKAGFIFGGSGGRAVLVARDQKTGKWVGPAFYGLATASIGFQAGIAV